MGVRASANPQAVSNERRKKRPGKWHPWLWLEHLNSVKLDVDNWKGPAPAKGCHAGMMAQGGQSIPIYKRSQNLDFVMKFSIFNVKLKLLKTIVQAEQNVSAFL